MLPTSCRLCLFPLSPKQPLPLTFPSLPSKEGNFHYIMKERGLPPITHFSIHSVIISSVRKYQARAGHCRYS